MDDKANKSKFLAKIDRLKGKTVFLYLTLITVFIRLPFFFRDYVDRDESTFILMGQAWVDGYLPYTYLWDVKPPLTFLFFAIIIFLFGKSFIAIRLIGALFVALTSFFTYSLTSRLSTKRAGLATGIACVLLQSMFGSIQGVMSEHILMVFFMAALYFLTLGTKYNQLLLAGITIGIALMVKISIAFPVLLVGVYLLLRFYRENSLLIAFSKALVLVIPAILVIVLTILPYLQTGQIEIWWNSVILAPLAYTESGRTSLISLLLLCLPIVVLIFWGYKKGRLNLKNPKMILLVLSVLGLLLSFLKGGRINSHYLIQLYPPLLILLAVLFTAEIERIKPVFIPWILGILLLLPIETYLEYWHVVQYKNQRGSLYNGEGFSVPSALKEKGLDKEKILFFGYHIGYWLLDTYPPAKTVTHPSNICKSEMFPFYNPERQTAMDEIRYVMEELKPAIVITRSNRKVFHKTFTLENDYIDSLLLNRYQLLERIDNADIYKLSN